MSATAATPDGGHVHVGRKGDVAWITLAHAGRLNAITVSMWRQLADIFNEVGADTGLRCVVIRGLDENFAAGADIREFPQYRSDKESVVRYHTGILAPALQAIAACMHPVVAMIRGVCVGGGLEIASQCDFRMAASNARFGVPINRLGFPMAPDEMQGLLRLAGPVATLEILLEGRVFGAEEAHAKGLLTRVVPDTDLQEEVDALVRRLCRAAPLAARINKETVRRLAPPLPSLTQADLDHLFRYAETRDHQEGVDAFLAGRTPKFSGD